MVIESLSLLTIRGTVLPDLLACHVSMIISGLMCARINQLTMLLYTVLGSSLVRVAHGYGYTRGIGPTGMAGMGTVSDLATCGHTVPICICGYASLSASA
jgi:hypothetical protein